MLPHATPPTHPWRPRRTITACAGSSLSPRPPFLLARARLGVHHSRVTLPRHTPWASTQIFPRHLNPHSTQPTATHQAPHDHPDTRPTPATLPMSNCNPRGTWLGPLFPHQTQAASHTSTSPPPPSSFHRGPTTHPDQKRQCARRRHRHDQHGGLDGQASDGLGPEPKQPPHPQ